MLLLLCIEIEFDVLTWFAGMKITVTSRAFPRNGNSILLHSTHSLLPSTLSVHNAQAHPYSNVIYLDSWNLGLLPKSALTVEEEAWNAYPYSKCICYAIQNMSISIQFRSLCHLFCCFLLAAKTRYTCPFVEKFSLEIETYYYPDDGHQENVFKLDGSDLRNRIVGKLAWHDYGNVYVSVFGIVLIDFAHNIHV